MFTVTSTCEERGVEERRRPLLAPRYVRTCSWGKQGAGSPGIPACEALSSALGRTSSPKRGRMTRRVQSSPCCCLWGESSCLFAGRGEQRPHVAVVCARRPHNDFCAEDGAPGCGYPLFGGRRRGQPETYCTPQAHLGKSKGIPFCCGGEDTQKGEAGAPQGSFTLRRPVFSKMLSRCLSTVASFHSSYDLCAHTRPNSLVCL